MKKNAFLDSEAYDKKIKKYEAEATKTSYGEFSPQIIQSLKKEQYCGKQMSDFLAKWM